MVRTVRASELRANLAEFLGRVAYGNEVFLVERRGKPFAALVPAEEVAERQCAIAELQKVAAQVKEQVAEYTPEEIEEAVRRAVSEVRANEPLESLAQALREAADALDDIGQRGPDLAGCLVGVFGGLGPEKSVDEWAQALRKCAEQLTSAVAAQ